MESLLLNNQKISFEDIRAGIVEGCTPFERSTLAFCRQWLNGQATFSLKTSGSTGEPKSIEVTREQMQLSARQTIEYFRISPVDTVLVCLNTAYIAGIMMLVRAMESSARIIAVEPEGNPLSKIDETINFFAVVPLQLDKILTDPETNFKLEQCRATLVGGAPVSAAIEDKLSMSSAKLYSTFAMTETLTHFALKQLNPVKEDSYTIMEGVTIGQDDRKCLTVTSPVTLGNTLATNDLVELIDNKSFNWLGRIDNVINSGGVKIHIEELESKVEGLFYQSGIEHKFFFAGLPDPNLGEKVVLIIESSSNVNITTSIDFSQTLDRYEMPKEIICIPNFSYTPTGKINRTETIRALKFTGN